jgi:hypothetical protein
MAKTVPVANAAAAAVRRAVAQERAASKTLESRFLSTSRLSQKSPPAFLVSLVPPPLLTGNFLVQLFSRFWTFLNGFREPKEVFVRYAVPINFREREFAHGLPLKASK